MLQDDLMTIRCTTALIIVFSFKYRCMNFSWISIAVLALALYISVLVHQDQGIMTEISRRGASYSFKNEQISIIVPTYKEVMNLRILT
jgi:hypothetical protein